MADLREFFDQQLEHIQAGDVDGLMEGYDDEAVLLRLDMAAEGRDAVRDLFRDYLDPPPRVVSVDAFSSTEDTMAYEATLAFGDFEERTYGTFVMRDGKVWRQVAGVVTTSDAEGGSLGDDSQAESGGATGSRGSAADDTATGMRDTGTSDGDDDVQDVPRVEGREVDDLPGAMPPD